MNVNRPVLSVKHAELERDSEKSDFKSVCPACKEGALLVCRDPQTAAVLRHDTCTLCGQHVYYTDASIAGWSLPEEN